MENEEMQELAEILDDIIKKDTVMVNTMYFGRLQENGIPAKYTTYENGVIVNEKDAFLPVEFIRGIIMAMMDKDQSEELGIDALCEANGMNPLYEEE